uniref:histidine kinase n=1 Tax=Chromera velia CCMP2878 TaxID=1169474 RepID=A0A0G4HIR4_9ALVE|eukprot:Cvel_1083.t1-p1 / transcript=Cvel_1083.t1 / gene=Cvel_1083 / organism=Chromera_velia_CCMP2878 / gene_product=hypothetical protein / transcript_product=hypothetical protein / location=Cvel_scaffold35:67342-68786(+) / protein_length=285 / sequence_SO=supercontig / SO=protein_coding / is_pseudo=false
MQILLQGHYGLALKAIIGVMHFSDVHFWLLNLSKTVFWLMGCKFGCSGRVPESELSDFWGIVGAFAMCQTAICAGIRFLCTLTLREAADEVCLRRKAEDLKDRFLSYIMHEMRNPLSGASLLIFEFQAVIKEVLKTAKRDPHPNVLHASVCKSAKHLQQLTEFLIPQFEKMRGVCDDVLQLEKLEKGGLEYNFKPMSIRSWVSRLAGQAAPLFTSQKNTVCFSSEISVEGADAEALLDKRPRGVADFVRLDQVVSNFLGNAKKFTKKGSVKLECALRMPSEEEQK